MEFLESFETETDCCSNYSQDNTNKAIKENKQRESLKSQFLSISYISEEDINRCWFFFSDLILCQNSLSNILVDYKLDKGDSTFKIGNEFSCYWIGLTKIHYKCIESKNDYFIKKISWKIFIDIGLSLTKQYTIYPISNNNTSLIKEKIEIIQPDNEESICFEENKDYYYNLQNSIMKYKAKLMYESKKYRFIHESFIAKSDFETTWKKIIYLNKLCEEISGNIGEIFICNGDPEKIGAFWKCNLNNNIKPIYFKVKKIIKNKKRNKWVYHLETIGAEFNIIKQEVEISVTKINKNSNQISILIIFTDNIDKNLYDAKKKALNEVMKNIKLFVNQN